MKRKTTRRPDKVTDRFIGAVCARMADNKRVRRNLPEWGRIHIDRQLPFLCIYRQPVRGSDAGTDRLVTSEAAYLIAKGTNKPQPGLAQLVRAVAETQARQFGAFLIVELWAGQAEEDPTRNGTEKLRPGFRIIAPKGEAYSGFISAMEELFARISIRRQAAQTQIRQSQRCCPKGLPLLLPVDVASEYGCCVLGLEVRPVYRAADGGEVYPQVLRELRRGVSQALRQTFHEFMCRHTTHRPKHYQMLGRQATVRAVWEVDRQLAEVSDSFDFLLQVTPVNAEQAWHDFQKHGVDQSPMFHYRPLPLDPAILKRRLYSTPIERVEDPTLALLLRQKQEELDRQITMLSDINTERFVHGSVQLFGGVGDDLKRLAEQILFRLPPRTRDDSKGGHLDATAFARKAETEIAYYRERWPQLDAGVQVRKDTASGLMVSRGSLLIGKQTRIPATRVEPLLQHEIGTHVLTYYNGRAQPFRQLYSGLAGYEAFQEGLAVLAEYLVGGLSRPRMRLLAARVLATRHMVSGATFVETFRELDGLYGFDRRSAFTVAMRIYRGGGLTKDAVYLRGLCQILEYLGNGGELAPLFIGKIAADHVPVISELRWRNVLREPPLVPRYMEMPDAISRLDELRKGMTILNLIDGRL